MGSKPLKRSPPFDSGTWRGPNSLMRSLIALMCAGVVPQHPPTTLTSPSLANLATALDVSSGVSS